MISLRLFEAKIRFTERLSPHQNIAKVKEGQVKLLSEVYSRGGLMGKFLPMRLQGIIIGIGLQKLENNLKNSWSIQQVKQLNIHQHHLFKMNIDLLMQNSVEMVYDNRVVSYFEILNFEKFNIAMGLTAKGWLVKDQQEIIFIDFENGNYISLVRILQVSAEEILEQLNMVQRRFELYEYTCKELFPIIKITESVFFMESDYWSKLALQILLKLKVSDISLKHFLEKYSESKWQSQKLRHLVKRVIRSQ